WIAITRRAVVLLCAAVLSWFVRSRGHGSGSTAGGGVAARVLHARAGLAGLVAEAAAGADGAIRVVSAALARAGAVAEFVLLARIAGGARRARAWIGARRRRRAARAAAHGAGAGARRARAVRRARRHLRARAGRTRRVARLALAGARRVATCIVHTKSARAL